MTSQSPYFPITDDQIRKVYAQPTHKERIEMSGKIYDEMMFFMERKRKGIFDWENLPIIVLSEEERERTKGKTLDEMAQEIMILESEKGDYYKLKPIQPKP